MKRARRFSRLAVSGYSWLGVEVTRGECDFVTRSYETSCVAAFLLTDGAWLGGTTL